ncbi:MAG: hypothetical protein LBL46_04815 [Rickettsiales bacterium]|nr:hypothetical protein [Rickettsiales bacterium]
MKVKLYFLLLIAHCSLLIPCGPARAATTSYFGLGATASAVLAKVKMSVGGAPIVNDTFVRAGNSFSFYGGTTYWGHHRIEIGVDSASINADWDTGFANISGYQFSGGYIFELFDLAESRWTPLVGAHGGLSTLSFIAYADNMSGVIDGHSTELTIGFTLGASLRVYDNTMIDLTIRSLEFGRQKKTRADYAYETHLNATQIILGSRIVF